MAYRSDLDAAHARIAALERELAEAKKAKRKPLRCGTCGAPVEHGDLDPKTGDITCSACRRVANAGRPAPTRRGVPRGLDVEDTPERLRVAWTWQVSTGELIATLLIAATIAGILIKGGDPPAAVIGAAIVLGVFGLLLGWRVFAQLCNRTVVEVGDGRLSIESGPVAIGGRYQLDRSEIDQLYCTMSTSKYSAWYSLHVRLRSGRHRSLIGEIPDAERAFYLEHELERRLGVTDRPVDGEVARR